MRGRAYTYVRGRAHHLRGRDMDSRAGMAGAGFDSPPLRLPAGGPFDPRTGWRALPGGPSSKSLDKPGAVP